MTALDTLITTCRRRAIGLWRKRWPTVDRADAEQNLWLCCADAVRRYRPGRRATLETYALSLFKAACAREHAQLRYGVELDNSYDFAGDDQRPVLPESYLYRWWPKLFDPAGSIDELDERHIRQRLALLPPALRQFAQIVLDDALGCAQAAEMIGVCDRQGRYNISRAVRLLEQSPGMAQLDLFGELGA